MMREAAPVPLRDPSPERHVEHVRANPLMSSGSISFRVDIAAICLLTGLIGYAITKNQAFIIGGLSMTLFTGIVLGLMCKAIERAPEPNVTMGLRSSP